MPCHVPRRRFLQGLALGWMLAAAAAALPAPAAAQGVDLTSLQLSRQDGELLLEFSARPILSRPVEDALQRGVPVYFMAQATLLRSRWYWRDERITRVQRSWRIAYQPLTSTWRVGLGALSQTVGSLSEALAVASTAGHWKLADLSLLDPDARHYIEFSYRLDTTQLPSPMQIGLPGPSDWDLRVDRRVPVE